MCFGNPHWGSCFMAQVVFLWNVLSSLWSGILSLINWGPQITWRCHWVCISVHSPLCQGPGLVVDVDDRMRTRRRGAKRLRSSLQNPPGKTPAGHRMLIREDGSQKEAASFCHLTKEIIPDVWPLVSRTFPQEPWQPWLGLWSLSPCPQGSASFSVPDLCSLRTQDCLTSNIHLLASMSRWGILVVLKLLHLECASLTASCAQQCLRNPLAV